MGEGDDLKIYEKHLTPGRYAVQKICPPKNGGHAFCTIFICRIFRAQQNNLFRTCL